MWREEESGFFSLLQGNISGSLLEHLRVDSFRLLQEKTGFFWVAFGTNLKSLDSLAESLLEHSSNIILVDSHPQKKGDRKQ